MASPPGVIGRSAELAALLGFVQAVQAGLAAMIVHGDSGIGKTTLWKRALDVSSGQGYVTLMARPSEHEAQLSFVGLGDLVGPVIDDTLEHIPEPQADALEVALLRKSPVGAPADQRALSLAIVSLLRVLAERNPILLGIDDAQWLDQPSTRVLEFALRRLEDEPIGVIATVRGAKRSTPLSLDRNTREDRVFRLDVGPMSVEEIDALIRESLGEGLPRPVLLQLHRTSGGNPFIAQEMARALQRRGGALPGQPLPVPDNVTELVRERLQSLSANAQEVLLVTSALSQPNVGLVKAAVGDWMMPGLGEAAEAGVIEIDDDRIRFTHQMLASAAYHQAAPERRRRLHWHLATLIVDSEERSRHLALGTAGTDAAAAAAVDQGAGTARARGAPSSAAELLELARRLTPPESKDEIRRRSVEAAECHFESGNSKRARELLEEAERTVSPGPERSLILRRLGTVRYHEENWEAAATLFTQSLKEASGEPALTAGLHRDLAWVRLMQGEVDAGASHGRDALELAEKLGDRRLLAEALTVTAFGEVMQGIDSSLDTIRRAVALEEYSPTVAIFRHPTLMYAVLLKWTDHFNEARDRFEAIHRHALEQGDDGSLPFLLYHMAELESWAGHWDRAAACAETSYQVSIQTGQEPLRAVALYSKALVDAHVGQLDTARAAAEEGLAVAERTGAFWRRVQNLSVLGFIELSLGNFGEAHRHLGVAQDIVSRIGLKEPGMLRLTHNEIEALVGMGQLDAAENLLDEWEALAQAKRRASALAVAARCRGLITAARGAPEKALAQLHRAVELHQQAPVPFELGRTLLLLGETYRRTKQRQAARLSLEEARALFNRLGASVWAARAMAEMDRLGVRPESRWDLTPTERRIAQLVAAGKTNREVADALFLSPKTVAANLSKIYTKMAIRSRTELAAKLASSLRTAE